ncbi:hypothetical protein FPZ24_01940 [Sphingomonas panacisoli]|uniref:Uncharacterized protein n=1 Tax=Sphingomonas panacisoli TaxID=1813879 RepID=A0A5B8LF65_9SPHN|nr:hypothetical protein [Sphingomonas panacisoli]QDZ06385.1 hypothetical protein FPZ24_01940 [Sphingomonas panacisoli]
MVEGRNVNWAAGLPPLPTTVVERRNASKTFNAWAQAILDEWQSRKGMAAEKGEESPNAWFKRQAYGLLAHYIETGQDGVFRLNPRADARPSRLVEEALKNPFKLGLLAMFADESPLSRKDRHVFGNQMLYAWAHDVPPELINGFLAVSGHPTQIAEKLKCGHVEPGFEQRHKSERLP